MLHGERRKELSETEDDKCGNNIRQCLLRDDNEFSLVSKMCELDVCLAYATAYFSNNIGYYSAKSSHISQTIWIGSHVCIIIDIL